MQSYSRKPTNLYQDTLNLRVLFTGSLQGDRPLLSELGIDLTSIRSESTIVFDVITKRFKYEEHQSCDCIGPVVFIALFAFALTLKAKLHFGYIYFLCICNVIGIFGLINLLCTEYIGLTACCNALGYSFLPIVLFSWSNLFLFFVPQTISIVLGVIATVWATFVSTQLLSHKLGTYDKTLIIGYPIFLGYFGFVLMAIF